MKTVTLALLATALAVPAQAAPPPTHPGVGVVLGEPTGGTLRWFLSANRSLDFGVGYSGDAALWLDHAWHAWDLSPRFPKGEGDLWVSAGGRLEFAKDTEFGVRTLVGLSYWFPGRPVELFGYAGPVFRMAPDGGVDADGGVGVRFYFGGLDGR